MSFLNQEPSTFIGLKLTNIGRSLLAKGKLTFDKAVVSDREVDYAFNHRYPNTDYFSGLNAPESEFYDFCKNRIIEPKDKNPSLPSFNLDGSLAYNLQSKTFVTKQTVTAQTESTGFWSATTDFEHTINDYILHPDRYINQGTMLDNDLSYGASSFEVVSGSLPEIGNLIFIPVYSTNFAPPLTYPAPMVYNFYKVVDVSNSPDTVFLDRNLPSLDSASFSEISWYEYPSNGIEVFYGSATTENCPVWNLNIVRTSREIGMKDANDPNQCYSSYASKEFAGTKKYFGFYDDYRQVGFIHFTNQYTGNTYAEQFIPGETEVDIPHIMWHRKDYDPGVADKAGERFTDLGSSIYYDQIAQTNYTILKDSSATDAIEVGRVYYKLKLIVITDPELLTVLSYKANRNWTLPPLILNAQSEPKSPLTTENATGLIDGEHNYYATYLPMNFNSASGSTLFSLGYKSTFHCGYISKIEGEFDEDGNRQFLTCSFPTRAFPYLRNVNTSSTFSGTGWSCNNVQILVQKVKKEEDFGIDVLHPGNWSGASQTFSVNTEMLGNGNGVYSGETTHITIDPSFLQSHQFIISLEDIQSGQTMPSFTTGQTYGLSEEDLLTNLDKLNLGYETFFFGNIKTKILSSVYKTVFTIETKDNELNGSMKEDFNGEVNENVYFTEFGILNEDGELVAIGKPTYPIKKNSARHLTFQLEIDF